MPDSSFSPRAVGRQVDVQFPGVRAHFARQTGGGQRVFRSEPPRPPVGDDQRSTDGGGIGPTGRGPAGEGTIRHGRS